MNVEHLPEVYELDKRLAKHTVQARVWESDLCSNHKLLMLGVLHVMTGINMCWVTQDNLAGLVSFSTTKLSRLRPDLETFGWLDKVDPMDNFRGASGRSPVVLALPRLSAARPRIPDHCRPPAGRTANLRTGPPVREEVVSDWFLPDQVLTGRPGRHLKGH